MCYCSQEKETSAILFSGECSPLISGKENWCSSILKRIGGQLFPGEENWCSNSFKRKEVVKQITGKTVIKVDN